MIENTSSMDRAVAAGSAFTRPRIIAAVVLLVVLIGLAFAFPLIRRWSRADRAVDASTLTIGTVTRGDLVRDVSVQGRVVAALHPTLVSPAQGIVTLRTKAGSVVRNGDVLAIVDSPELHSTLEQAKAQLLSFRTDYERGKIAGSQSDARLKQQVALSQLKLEAARRALQRAELLRKDGLLNGPDYEKAQDDVHVSELELAQAQHEIGLNQQTVDFDVKSRKLQVDRQRSATDETQKRFDDLTIRAPFDGMVAAITVNERDAVAANQPILTVINLSSLELEITIPEEYAADVRIGTPLMIGYGSGEHAAHITAVSPEIVGNQITARAVPDQQWPEGLRQNQRVSARLVFESKKGVLKLPRGAFVEASGGRSAYVVDGGMATRRAITLGSVGASEVEIVSGLREGDRVILSDTSPFGNVNTLILR
ncbi:MAG TPA: efflux RND transporter periplasmic adaptor subunit [Thermoanaerobaculia bacterium]|jgi:HlyD family secretion protein|nr:efflux RND transporter periplasmic adaptor subunit [Thermoanaerobaculia bacterium]